MSNQNIAIAVVAIICSFVAAFGCGCAFAQHMLIPPPPVDQSVERGPNLGDVIANQNLEIQMLMQLQDQLKQILVKQRERDIKSISPF